MEMKYVNFCRWFAVLVLLQTFMPPGAESKPVPGKKANMALSALAGMTAGHLISRAVAARREKKEKLDMSEHLPPNCRREVRTERDKEDWNKFIETKYIVCDPLPNQPQQPQQQQQIVSTQTGSPQQQQALYLNLYVPQQQPQQQQHLYMQQHHLQHQPQQQQQPPAQQQQPRQQYLQQPQQKQQPHQQQQPQQQYLQQQQSQLQQPQQSQHPQWHPSPIASHGQTQQFAGQVLPQPSYYMPIYPKLPVAGFPQPASQAQFPQQFPSAQQQNNQTIAQQQHSVPCANHSIQKQPEKTVSQAVEIPAASSASPTPVPQTTERSKPILAFMKKVQESVEKRKAEQAAQQTPNSIKDSYLRIQQAVNQPNPPTEEQHKPPPNNSEQVANAAAAQVEQITQPSSVVPAQPAAPAIQQVQPAAAPQPSQEQHAAYQQSATSGQPIGFVQPPQQAGQLPAQSPQIVQSPQPVPPVQTVQIPQGGQTGPQPMQPVQVVQQAQPAQPAQGPSQVFIMSKKTGYFRKNSADKILQTNLVLMMMMAFLLIWFQ